MIDPTYYVIPSLPYLERHARPPLSMPDFRAACHPLLTDEERETFDAISLYQKQPADPGIPALRQWYHREHAIRNELVRLRAERRRKDPTPYLRATEPDPHAAQIAEEVFAIDSPLEAENRLDDYRWAYLEQLEFDHDFNLTCLLLYSLKLQILLRRADFDEAAGQAWLTNRRQRVEELTRFAIREYNEPEHT